VGRVGEGEGSCGQRRKGQGREGTRQPGDGPARWRRARPARCCRGGWQSGKACAAAGDRSWAAPPAACWKQTVPPSLFLPALRRGGRGRPAAAGCQVKGSHWEVVFSGCSVEGQLLRVVPAFLLRHHDGPGAHLPLHACALCAGERRPLLRSLWWLLRLSRGGAGGGGRCKHQQRRRQGCAPLRHALKGTPSGYAESRLPAKWHGKGGRRCSGWRHCSRLKNAGQALAGAATRDGVRLDAPSPQRTGHAHKKGFQLLLQSSWGIGTQKRRSIAPYLVDLAPSSPSNTSRAVVCSSSGHKYVDAWQLSGTAAERRDGD
jgi:hypothetical protein